MKEQKNNRTKWVHVRLTEEEHAQLTAHFKSTTERKISGYIRNLLLEKPMIKSYRNGSLQDIITTLLELRKDLSGIANNYNQAVHKLHLLDNHADMKTWLIALETDRRTMLASIENIRVYIDRTAEKWLQS